MHVGKATRIDPPGRRVLGDGWELPYDTLLVAVGSRTATGVPGSVEHVRSVGDAASAELLHRDVAALAPGSVVAVVGGGLTGVETAAEIADRRPGLDVRLVAAGRIAPGLGDHGYRIIRRALDDLGVTVVEGTTVARVLPGRLEFAGGGGPDVAACAWAASMVAPELARDSGLAVDDLGRLIVDETLRHPGYPEIVGAGDAVAPPDDVAGHLRMACATAMPLGALAADVVLARIAGRPDDVLPISVGFVLQCVSLGRRAGVVQPVHRDDSPRTSAVGGRTAAVVKELICRATVAGLRAERVHAGAYPVVHGPRRSTVVGGSPGSPDEPPVMSWSA